jgi:hypothetical protein
LIGAPISEQMGDTVLSVMNRLDYTPWVPHLSSQIGSALDMAAGK